MSLTEADKILKLRSIQNIKSISTPLIVPGFSSVVCNTLNETYVTLHNQLTYASLISAYDLSYQSISLKEVWGPKILFVDSGCWEVEFLIGDGREPNEWSSEKYIETLREITKESRTPMVAVSYDKYGRLKDQMDSATKLFDNFGNFISDFLVKPPSQKAIIELDELCQNIRELNFFDILGFTEKELGDSVLERCRGIAKVRMALNEAGMEKPIHIFGCSDPIGILAYFLCGADIFDGVSWLKYGFHDGSALYMNNYAFLKSFWTKGERGVREMAYIYNLNELSQLMSLMQYFAQSHEPGDLNLPESTFKLLQRLVGEAGVQI